MRLVESNDGKSSTPSNNQPLPVDSSGARSAAMDRQVSNATPAVLFPPRPGHYTLENFVHSLLGGEDASGLTKRESRSQAQVPPSESLRLPHHSTTTLILVFDFDGFANVQTEPVDYYPWTGNHPEDSLTDQTIKSGFQNKPVVSNETNNAAVKTHCKPFKDKVAIPTLSSLFATVLEKRQAFGRIAGPSTAKPPPRVSLTSSRREAWLQDLSNPVIPLRKLNRTIPFGITGKVLLEQCLTKNIPIARAVWLSKAVGINELRAYKRKGATGPTGLGGELKWIREWTVHVQQFIESTSELCGQADFKHKMQYAITLSSHLFAENLLDQDTFTEWLLSSSEKAPIERLPMWLLLIRVQWKNLVSTRKRSRRLAQCLLSRIDAASSDPSKDILTPVIKRMQLFVATLVVKNKGSMILPSVWPQYQSLLAAMADDMLHPSIRSSLEELNVRNEHLTPGSRHIGAPHSRRKLIVDLLDSTTHETNFDELIEICCNIGDDLQMVATTVLEWASSIYRSGTHQVYLTIRMLRKFYDLEVDVDSIVIPLLSRKDSHRFNFAKVLTIVAALVRSSHFSVGRFCQALIVRGSAGAALEGSEPDRRLLTLLKELPIDDCPERVCTLRRLLLKEAGIKLNSIDNMASIIQTAVDKVLADPSATDSTLPSLSAINASTRIALDGWLQNRLKVLSQYVNESCEFTKDHGCSITRREFYVYRYMLEQLQDLDLLGELLHIAITSDEQDVMTSVVETLQYHLDSFAANGSLQGLTEKLIDRYQMLRLKSLLDKPLVAAMSSLFATLNSDSTMQLQLKNDLAQCHQRATVAMCSPASDNAVDVLMSDDVDTDDEIDRILTSGTTMDEQIVARVFKRITTRVSEWKGDDPCYAIRCGQWFSKLRAFDSETFDNLMQEWMTKAMTSNRRICLSILPALVGCGCSTVASFVQCTNYCRAPAKLDRNFCAELDIDTLEAILSTSPTPKTGCLDIWYTYKVERQKFVGSSTATILGFFQRAVQSCGTCEATHLQGRLRSLLAEENVSAFLKRAAVQASQDFQNCVCSLSSDDTAAVGALNKEGILSLFDLDKPHLDGEYSDEIMQLFEIADELSLPMCQLELLRLIPRNMSSKTSSVMRSASKEPFECLQNNLMTICDASAVWQEMLSVLDTTCVSQLCNVAERDHFAVLKKIVDATMDLTPVEGLENYDQASGLLQKNFTVVEALSIGRSSPRFFTIFDPLKGLVEALSSHRDSISEDGRTSPYIRCAAESIYCLLRLFLLLKHSDGAHKLQSSDLSLLVPLLCTILALPALQPFSDLLQFTYDILTYFSDDLTDDQRTHFSRLETPWHATDALPFIFGAAPNAQDSWLALVTSAAPAAPAPTPSPAQRFHQQQVAPATPRPAPRVPAARALSQPQAKLWNAPVPFPLRRWEVLPDAGGSSAAAAAAAAGGAGGNDTSVSLALFGARRVG